MSGVLNGGRTDIPIFQDCDLISYFQKSIFSAVSAPPCAALNCRNLFISSYLSAVVVYDLAMVTLVFLLFVYSIIITSAESEAPELPQDVHERVYV